MSSRSTRITQRDFVDSGPLQRIHRMGSDSWGGFIIQNHGNRKFGFPITHVNSGAGLAATCNPSVQETGSYGKLAALAEFSESRLRS